MRNLIIETPLLRHGRVVEIMNEAVTQTRWPSLGQLGRVASLLLASAFLVAPVHAQLAITEMMSYFPNRSRAGEPGQKLGFL